MQRVLPVLLLVGAAFTGALRGPAPSWAQTPGSHPIYLPLVVKGAVLSGPQSTPTPAATPAVTPTPTAEKPLGPGNCISTTGFSQVHLGWTGDTSTTLTVVWQTNSTATPSQVQYRPQGSSTWLLATGAPRPSGTSGMLHETGLQGLAPATTYEYCVQGDDGVWSKPFTGRTAPASGPADFTAIYVADTGLVGRSDGLANGTQQIIDEIAKLQPDVVLGGGDYAYFDSDKRYGTYEKSIDAWFNQMQTVVAFAPLMATYGNHEYELDGAPLDVRPWSQRLPSPPPFLYDRQPGTAIDKQPNFSFDVGDVHFVALFAATDQRGVADEILEWFERDAAAARARGMRWIIPYYHVTPFGDAKNHQPNLMLREDLGPVFERSGVKIAIASHDQAYERSWPLQDVPATNRPTSSNPSCYTMSDGATYVKVSPGGKKSNISGGFSPFTSSTLPAWTAARDNTMHHFARLVVSASGTITFEAYGVKGDGSPAVVLDTFVYTMGSCG